MNRYAIGQVLEIATPLGYAYLQFVDVHPEMGDLIRVLIGYHPDPLRGGEIERVVHGGERYYLYIYDEGVRALIEEGGAVPLGVFDLPDRVHRRPLMKTINPFSDDLEWHIFDDDDEERATVHYVTSELSREERSLPLWGMVATRNVLSRLDSDWTPELDTDACEEQHLETSRREPSKSSRPRCVLHYAFVPNANTERVVSHLRRLPTVSDVVVLGIEAGDVLVEAVVDEAVDHDRAVGEIAAAVEHHGGRYDGWQHELA